MAYKFIRKKVYNKHVRKSIISNGENTQKFKNDIPVEVIEKNKVEVEENDDICCEMPFEGKVGTKKNKSKIKKNEKNNIEEKINDYE